MDNLEIVNATTSSNESQQDFNSKLKDMFNSAQLKFKKSETNILKRMSEITLKIKKFETSFYTSSLTAILEDLEDDSEAEKALALYKNLFGGKFREIIVKLCIISNNMLAHHSCNLLRNRIYK